MRTTYLEPDYRKDPNSDIYCCRCQKSLKGKNYRWVIADPKNNLEVVHPDDLHELGLDINDHAAERIGTDCAKKIGIEFTFKL